MGKHKTRKRVQASKRLRDGGPNKYRVHTGTVQRGPRYERGSNTRHELMSGDYRVQ